MSEFELFMKNIGDSDEINGIIKMAKGNAEYENAIIDFIKKNNIDCTHLWEDSETGNKAYDDWEKLITFVLELIPEEEK